MARPRNKPAAPAPPPPPTPPAPPKPKPRAPTPPPATPWTAHLLPVGSLIGLAVLLYAPSLDGPFVYDDPNSITQSALIRQLTPLTRFLTMSTRPLTDFSFALDYASGGYTPRSYHVTSLALHIANAALLYAIAFLAFTAPALVRRYGAVRRPLAWATAVLFVVHPLASESVAYMSSRSEVLVAFFFLLALFGYQLATAARSARIRRAGTILVPVAAAAGLGSKEIAAGIPFALALYDWLLVAGGSWERTRPRRRLIGLALAPLLLGGTLLLMRAYLNPITLGNYGTTAGLSFDRFGRFEYLMTQFGVIVHYLRLLVLPVGQTFDYDWPLARTPLAFGVLLPFVLLCGLAWAAWRCRRSAPLVTLAVGWTALILAPTSSILPIADLAVERRMYLPLAAIALLATSLLWDLAARLGSSWRTPPTTLFAVLVALPVIAFSFLTFQRASLWGDAIALHEDGAAKAPGNPRMRLNLGVTYLNLGRKEQAYTTLLEAKTLYDQGESVHAFPRIGAFIHYNLGAVQFSRGDIAAAEPQLKRSLELGSQYLALRPMADMLLARIAVQRKDFKTAITYMAEAIEYQENADWRVDLAQMQLADDQHVAALMTLKRTLEFNPDNKRALEMLQDLKEAGLE
ncbi:MAG: tetratricopeptide repeat protein [Candidatus Binatia bacterium]